MMAPPPDLNSLPPSPSSLRTGRNSSTSLAGIASATTAATASASASSNMHPTTNDVSRRSSATSTNNNPASGSPHPGRSRRGTGILASGTISNPDNYHHIPHHHQHHRQPSLGEIHNELEQEQEAQVNRMLQLIRDQQLQLDALRSSSNSAPGAAGAGAGATATPDPLTPASEERRSISRSSSSVFFPSPHPAIPSGQAQPPPRLSLSRNQSPALRPVHSSSIGIGSTNPNDISSTSADLSSPSPLDILARRNSSTVRDESSFYQAETAALTRDNQLLRQRIRELEKQVSDLTAAPPSTSATVPNPHSNTTSTSSPTADGPLSEGHTTTGNE